jgi:uncharacterized protein (DUF1501 family)
MEETPVALNRRQFLTGVIGAGAATGLVRFTGLDSLLRMAEASAATPPKNGPFVLCTLYGGNDGLNTVIPYESGIYRDWRGELAIPGDEALPLGHDGTAHLGFHPSLTALYALWKAGKVAVINGVEYPNPNFSHFQSTFIWQTAQLSGNPGIGWIGRWLDMTGPDPFRALAVGPTLPTALVGAKQQASSVADSTSAGSQLPGQNGPFSTAYKQLMTPYRGEPALEAGQAKSGSNLLAVGAEAAAALTKEQPPQETSGRDAGDIGTQLDLVAELIKYGLPTSVYSVSLASFDTHSDQADTHAGLLSSLDAAIESFMSDFPAPAPGKSPVIVIYSEFGRTNRVNASGGTDHSSASVVLVVGPAVKGGFYGAVPSFTRLDRYGNFVFTTDFRRVYATVLERILGIETPASVLGRSFRTIDFI